MTPTLILCALLGGYLLGSIPFGVIVTRLAGAGDLRQIGSGSIGATNVLRTGRKGLALLTVLGDGGKGALAVFIAYLATREAGLEVQSPIMALAGGAAFVGHLFPVWLRFRGGKGVATFFGTLLAIAWPLGVIAGAIWLLIAKLFKISSLSALVTAAAAPFVALLLARPLPVVFLTTFMSVLIYVRHEANIRRLLKGQEPKIGGDKA